MTKTNMNATIVVAQDLQEKREAHMLRLAELPMPKTHIVKFPYESMDAAIKDDFKLFTNGKDEAFRLLVKGYKTVAWRQAAEKNREVRDELAEGEIEAPKAAKKPRAKKSDAPKADANVS
jgi:hypothetical protein